eukprot:gnl/MRDRNA2_/MRDRNA2_83569_c0_seq1.p1 gnl/MRDRNA2_/MRDRNA2_83569_c0~~gnl/MRDRNA2_/MRDRNA2_83569_c0_seq1.p1  ORF type:complete len:162 (-),score=15.34 gnl/MRDRNA2_/MRDRNA2_83569_c0_seq1:644-1129(-)
MMGRSSPLQINLFFLLSMFILTAPAQCARVKRRTGTQNGTQIENPDPPIPAPRTPPLPAGDYQDTCTGCMFFQGAVLYCKECKDEKNNLKESSVPIGTCSFFTNRNGQLERQIGEVQLLPGGKPTGPLGLALPAGNYIRHYRGCSVLGDDLYCEVCAKKGI